MRAFVTGGAGFVGSNLIDELLLRDNSVVCYDNFSTGNQNFLKYAFDQPSKKFVSVIGDILNEYLLTKAMSGCDIVFHFAANADVRHGVDNTFKDLEQNTIGTANVLEAMRKNNIKKIVFISTGSIYGNTKVIPTPEDVAIPFQTSFYGASKKAGEGLVQAYCYGFDFQAYIFRFVSILGERYSHGHVFDFYKSLLKDPRELTVLGDGHQKKSYLYVRDCIGAIMIALEKANDKINVFNLGTDEYIEVNNSIKIITEELKINPKLRYTGGESGWVGDNPFIFLDCSKIRSLGWKPRLTIKEGILRTLDYLKNNQWILEEK